MKNLIYLFLGALFVISCKTDPCKDKVCGTAGTCSEGICICDTGYEQDSIGACNTEIRAKFLGNYSMKESCMKVSDSTVYIATHSIVINNSTTNVAQMLMTGLAVDNAGTFFTTTPSGTTFTVADNTQVSVDDGSGGSTLFNLKNVSGSLYATDSLKISYDLHSTTSNDLLFKCTAKGKRQ